MDVFIAGATGVLGRRLVRQFSDRGHRVRGIARDERGNGIVREAGGVPVGANLFDADELARMAEDAEVVIHAATAIPASGRTRAAWAMNDRIRRDGTRALSDAAVRVGARIYLQQSVVWVIRPPGGERFDETWEPNPSEQLQSSVDGERIAEEVAGGGGLTVAVLRNGVFYGSDVPSTLGIVEALRQRRLPVVGDGEAMIAPLHVDDAAAAFVAAAENGSSGVWHIVDDEPVAYKEFFPEVAQIVGAPPPRRSPVWLARLLAGDSMVATLTTSMNTTNARARRDFGWAPTYPTFREGLRAAVREWDSAPAPGRGSG